MFNRIKAIFAGNRADDQQDAPAAPVNIRDLRPFTPEFEAELQRRRGILSAKWGCKPESISTFAILYLDKMEG